MYRGKVEVTKDSKQFLTWTAIGAVFTGSKNAAALLSTKLTPQVAKYLDDLVEAGAISEENLQRSSSFLDDALPEAEQLGSTELKTIMENAGTMENSELSDLVKWLNEKNGTKNGRALEYLDEEAKQYLWQKSTQLTEKQLDDILDDIIKEVEGLEEATGVIENVGRKSVAEKVAKQSLGTDELIVRDVKYLDAYGNIDWNKWAPNGGRVLGTIQENQILDVKTIIDRYGSQFGKYTSPLGTPYEQRALPYIENANAYHKYEVIKPITDVTISEIAPAFDQIGGGIQYELPKSIKQLIQEGFLREIE